MGIKFGGPIQPGDRIVVEGQDGKRFNGVVELISCDQKGEIHIKVRLVGPVND
ncbi:MAG: hypothetical protein ACREDF_04060 [Thermoplasmata archaeon]